MPLWPDRVDPSRAGLTDAELLSLAYQDVLDANDVALLEATGLRVLTASEADLEGLTENERTLSEGTVVSPEGSFLRINPVLWAEVAEARENDENRAAALKRFGPRVPLPFWLVFAEPTPRALLFAVPDELDEDDFINFPDVDEVNEWADVSEEMLAQLAKAVLITGLPAQLYAPTYIRGSNLRDLVERPLRPLSEWLAAYPHLVNPALGGKGETPEESELLEQLADGRVPFWEALVMPPGFEPPPNNQHGEPDTWEGARRLAELGFFETQRLDPDVDRYALARFGTRTPDAWARSDFAELIPHDSSA